MALLAYLSDQLERLRRNKAEPALSRHLPVPPVAGPRTMPSGATVMLGHRPLPTALTAHEQKLMHLCCALKGPGALRLLELLVPARAAPVQSEATAFLQLPRQERHRAIATSLQTGALVSRSASERLAAAIVREPSWLRALCCAALSTEQRTRALRDPAVRVCWEAGRFHPAVHAYARRFVAKRQASS